MNENDTNNLAFSNYWNGRNLSNDSNSIDGYFNDEIATIKTKQKYTIFHITTSLNIKLKI